MGSIQGGTMILGVPGNRGAFLFPRRAHLLTTPKGQWYLPLASRALSEGDFAFCGKRQTMPQRLKVLLSSSARLEKCRRALRRTFSNRLRKPATGSFAAEMDGRSARPFSLLRKRNRKKENEVNERWQFTIWKPKWSAGARGALL